MNTQRLTYAIRNLALGALPSCWNWQWDTYSIPPANQAFLQKRGQGDFK